MNNIRRSYIFFIVDKLHKIIHKNHSLLISLINIYLYHSQTEIAKRLSTLINQLVPFLSPEHQQQVLTAVERAKQITMSELNAVIGVSIQQ